ncbi:unnamed protein product [Heligmosomoides polygyrus]|uniref:Uncharacterized protein n=1 Tax=Heligmosomoides polygyrus TaxID=6339 RepID=A0A183FTF0_HELPZ|nr:unnamed protein product [Heligmosomoides polygyrus]
MELIAKLKSLSDRLLAKHGVLVAGVTPSALGGRNKAPRLPEAVKASCHANVASAQNNAARGSWPEREKRAAGTSAVAVFGSGMLNNDQ